MVPRILVVDDEESIRRLYRLELEEDGYAVATAADAQQAFDILNRQSVDLVIMDIKMPGMNGIDALQKLVGIEKQVPVIINSGYAHFKESYITWLAEDYVVKSTDLSELKQTIRNVLQESGAQEHSKTLPGGSGNIRDKKKLSA